MISPTDKLLLWVALLLPFAALAGPLPGWAPLTIGMFVLLALCAALDARHGRADARAIAVNLPPVVRLSKDRPGVLPIEISNARATLADVSIDLALPPSIEALQGILKVRLPSGSEISRADWPCVSRERGSFRLSGAFFRICSPLGLWHVRGRTPCSTEIRTYPHLERERRQMASLFLNRGVFGIHRRRMLGQGREFEKLRNYIPGDSFEDIHWKATAKRGHPVTKLYQIERTQEVYALVDISRLSGKKVGNEPVIERFIAAALVLGRAAEQQGDRFGLLAFDDRVRHFVRAGGGRAHHAACRDTLYRLTPGAGSSDFEELFSFVNLRLRRRALLLVLTDLGDPVQAEDFERTVEHVRARHLVVVTMIGEEGTQPFFSSPPAACVDELYEKLGDHLIWETLRETGRRLQRLNVRLSLTLSERLVPEVVSSYISVKARQEL